MPSHSLLEWQNRRRRSLDEIENAHRSVGGTGRGRRYATQQINHAYAVMLSSQVQGFCRDLHFECADHFVNGLPIVAMRAIVRKALVDNRKLDRGNPNPDNIGADFGRFGIAFWDEVRKLDTRNEARQNHLRDLNKWRNAIAHQDFDPIGLGTTLPLQRVRQWRSACQQLAEAFDEVMRGHLQLILGYLPW